MDKTISILFIVVAFLVCWAIGADQHNRDVKNQQRIFHINFPRLDPAIEHARPFAVDPAPPEAEVLEHPPQARGHPASDVVVAHDA